MAGGRYHPGGGGASARAERTSRVRCDVVLTSYEMLLVESRCVFVLGVGGLEKGVLGAPC